MNRLYSALAALSILFVLASCDNEELDEQFVTSSTTTLKIEDVTFDLKDGLMTLASGSDLLILDQKFPFSHMLLRNNINSQVDFVSSGELYDRISEEDFIVGKGAVIPSQYKDVAYIRNVEGDKYVDRITEQSVLLELANTNGQLVVGDTLITIRPGHLVMIPVTDLLQFGNDPENHPNATSYWFEPKDFNQEQTLIAKADIGRDCILEFGPQKAGNRRLRGNITETPGIIGGVLGIGGEKVLTVATISKFYRRGTFGIYYPEEANRLIHDGCLVFGPVITGQQCFRTAITDAQFHATGGFSNGNNPVLRGVQGVTFTVQEGGDLESCVKVP